MQPVWLSPGFPAAPAALLDSLGADYSLAPPSTSPPAGSIAVVTGFERDLLTQLATRPAGTPLVVITPPDTPLPGVEISNLRVDAVVPAASIAEVARALRRLPAPVAPPPIADSPASPAGQDLPWWIRPAQDAPPVAAQPPHDTAAFATTPLPAFGQPVESAEAAPTETLAMGSAESPRRRFALTGRQARIASIAAVVAAVAITSVVVAVEHHSPSPTNAAANSPLSGTNNGGGNPAPFGNSNGSNGSNGGNGSGTGQGNGTSPQFGNQNPFGGQSGRSGQGTRREELQQFLTCLKQNGVAVDGTTRRSFDPTDPNVRAALTKCAPLMPFGRFGDGFGRSRGSSGSDGIGTNGNGTNGSNST